MDQELNAAVLPNGLLEVEWTDSEQTVDKSACMLYNRRYTKGPLTATVPGFYSLGSPARI